MKVMERKRGGGECGGCGGCGGQTEKESEKESEKER